MSAQLQMTPPRLDPRCEAARPASAFRLVAVASEPDQRAGESGRPQPPAPVSFQLRAFGGEPRRVVFNRVAEHDVARSAAWLRGRGKPMRVRDLTAGAIGVVPLGLSKLPERSSGILRLLEQEEGGHGDHQAMTAAISTLRAADAVIAGPLSPDDANAPGMVAHLADLARHAYRALRPARELIVHPGFAQVARRFQFIQMTHHDARSLAAGAIDVGILAHRLRQLQGAGGEFAITAFGGHGLLWAENRFWEIDPIGDDVNEVKAGAAFCSAWVAARRFLVTPASQALGYARAAAANSVLKK
jgi:hypothetical protein